MAWEESDGTRGRDDEGGKRWNINEERERKGREGTGGREEK